MLILKSKYNNVVFQLRAKNNEVELMQNYIVDLENKIAAMQLVSKKPTKKAPAKKITEKKVTK